MILTLKNIFKFLVLLLACSLTYVNAATCFCKLSKDELLGLKTATGVVKDLTGVVNKTYMTQGAFQQEACQASCRITASLFLKSKALAVEICAQGVSLGTPIKAYSAVGTKTYLNVLDFGLVTDSQHVVKTQYFCPAGWFANQTNILGGEAVDQRCKKLAAYPINISPLPTNGTPLGSWGFTWSDAIYAWGTSANGGAPKAVVTYSLPGECHFQ